MNGQAVILTITSSFRRNSKHPWKVLVFKTKELDFIMTQSTGQISLGTEMLYPNIIGDYSSLRVTVGIVVPADTAGIDYVKFKAAADPYKDIISQYMMETINESCTLVGKAAPFKP